MQTMRKRVSIILLLSAALMTGGFSGSALGQRETSATTFPADVILINGKIYTMNSRNPWAEAVAIRSGKIIAVGSGADVQRYRGAETKIIDAQLHMVLPGFTDSHIHFMDGSLSLTRVNLEPTKNVSEIQKVIKDFAVVHPAESSGNAWILGRGWSYPEFGAAGLPDRKYLDEVVPRRPVFLEGFDGHTYWANSKALQLAGIDKNTPDPPNGQIVHDLKTGEPTGALKESAADLVQRVLPKLSRAQRLAALRQGIAAANQAGLTRVHSCGGDFEYLDLWDELRRQGKLTLRIYMAYFLNPPELRESDLQQIESARQQYPAIDDWIEGGAVKMMMDGVIESHTAAMLTPYADEPTEYGKPFWEAQKYRQAVLELDRRGFQIFTHAIGDGAVRSVLDAYEAAQKTNQRHDARDRIEHIETITAADIRRFGSLGVIASMQPLHAYPDDDTLGPWLNAAGHEREPRAWAWQSIARSGGHLAFGSDWPVVTLNPWEGIQNAVTRQTLDGKPAGGWVPEQRLTLAQAIEGYTLDAAYGGHRAKTEGSIEAGKLADLVIISQNLFEIDAHKIADTHVLLTIVGGKAVYESPDWKRATVEGRIH